MAAFNLIQSVTVTTNTSPITFSNIPNTYGDLVIMGSARTGAGSNSSVDVVRIIFNSDTSSSAYSNIRLYQTTDTYTSNSSYLNSSGIGLSAAIGSPSNIFSSFTCYIPNYKSAKQKSYLADGLVENGASSTYQFLWSGKWNQTSTITQIDLYPEYGVHYIANSKFYLYGISDS